MRAPGGSIRLCMRGQRSLLVHDEEGLTLIEVMVSVLILALVSLAVLVALDAATRSSADLRLHAAAQALAQQDQDRMRGLSVADLSNLTNTLPPFNVTMDGTTFTVTSTASYVSNETGMSSCTSPSTAIDYIKTTSTVTWQNMGSRAPVAVSSILAPIIGSISSSAAGLAVSVDSPTGTGLANMTVAISGPSTASSETTDANGCVVFGDLAPGNYHVSVWSPTAAYINQLSGAAVTATSPYVTQQGVASGAVQPVAVTLGTPGSITFTFADAFPPPTGLTPPVTPAALAVVAFDTNMLLPQFRMCTSADGSTCPPVGSPDTSFVTTPWASSIVATPLFPFASTYAVYAGTCPNDDPGATSDPPAVVPAGGTIAVTLHLPAMVVKLWNGTSAAPGQEEALPAGAQLVITDTGCNNLRYTTATPTGTYQSSLPLNPAYPTAANDTGILEYPGMPSGSYTVCYYSSGRRYVTPTISNSRSGEVVDLYAGSAVSGSQC